jgi:N-methylhydantoinase A
LSENDAGRCIVAVDVGGTCTDCVVFDGEQTIHFGKALSTPPYFAQGVLDSVRVTAGTMGLSLEQCRSR